MKYRLLISLLLRIDAFGLHMRSCIYWASVKLNYVFCMLHVSSKNYCYYTVVKLFELLNFHITMTSFMGLLLCPLFYLKNYKYVQIIFSNNPPSPV